MPLNRETVYSGLFARLKAIPGIVTSTRRFRVISDFNAADFPALMMTQGAQAPLYETGRETQWRLDADVWIYVRDPAGDNPGAIMNPIADALAAVFAFDNLQRNACTLGGLVMRAELGAFETDEGTMAEQSVLRAPVSLYCRG